MARIIVYIRGGNVQGIVSDSKGVEVMIVDYDNEDDMNYLHRSFDYVHYDLIQFDRTVAGIES